MYSRGVRLLTLSGDKRGSLDDPGRLECEPCRGMRTPFRADLFPAHLPVTNVTPTGVRMCREGRDEKPSPAGRLTTCLLHVGRTGDWHGCRTRGWNKVRVEFEGLGVRWPELRRSSGGSEDEGNQSPRWVCRARSARDEVGRHRSRVASKKQGIAILSLRYMSTQE